MTEIDDVSSPLSGASAASGKFVLDPPAAVFMVDHQQAAGLVPVEAGKELELRTKADAFVSELADLQTRSPFFAEKVASINSMGQQDMRAAAAVSGRLLDRPALAPGNGKSGDDAQTRVSNALADLRVIITDLDPKRAELTGVQKLLRWMTGGDKVERYFARYQSAQAHLNAIIKALDSGQDELRKDNAAIETEKANMLATMGKLSEYNTLAGALDASLSARVAELEASGRPDDAGVLRSDALLPVRQRRADIMTQLAVTVQGYLALDLVRRNNVELIKGVDRAQTMTISALRTAVIVSESLSREKLILGQIAALNTAASDLVASASEQPAPGQPADRQDAATPAPEVARLQAAFDTVFATLDTLDTFRAKAADSMTQTVSALEAQIDRTRRPGTNTAR